MRSNRNSSSATSLTSLSAAAQRRLSEGLPSDDESQQSGAEWSDARQGGGGGTIGLRKLAEDGQHTSVYLLDGECVIKAAREDRRHWQDAQRTLRRELAFLGAADGSARGFVPSHPDILPILMQLQLPPTERGGGIAIAFPYCPSGDLTDWLASRWGWPDRGDVLLRHPEVAEFVVAAAVRALAHCHRHGVMHHDVKLENFLVQGEIDGDARMPKVLLGDFGLAVRGAECECEGRGTVEYMAPELLAHGRHDHRVDHWAVGCLVHELFSGDPPFGACPERHQIARVKRRIRDGRLIAPLPASVPDGARRLVASLLAPSQSQRPRDLLAFCWENDWPNRMLLQQQP